MSHIFSDKTGTLTANNMEFRRLAAGGRTYGVGETAISRSTRASGKSSATSFSSSGRSFISPRLSDRTPPPHAGCRLATAQYVSFTEGADDPSIWDDLPATDGALLREMMIAMAACHSVLLEADGDQARTHPPNARTPL